MNEFSLIMAYDEIGAERGLSCGRKSNEINQFAHVHSLPPFLEIGFEHLQCLLYRTANSVNFTKHHSHVRQYILYKYVTPKVNCSQSTIWMDLFPKMMTLNFFHFGTNNFPNNTCWSTNNRPKSKQSENT